MNKIVIQHKTHLALTNKKCLTKRNRQFRKIETPCKQTNNTEQTLIQEQKVNLGNLKRPMKG